MMIKDHLRVHCSFLVALTFWLQWVLPRCSWFPIWIHRKHCAKSLLYMTNAHAEICSSSILLRKKNSSFISYLVSPSEYLIDLHGCHDTETMCIEIKIMLPFSSTIQYLVSFALDILLVMTVGPYSRVFSLWWNHHVGEGTTLPF